MPRSNVSATSPDTSTTEYVRAIRIAPTALLWISPRRHSIANKRRGSAPCSWPHETRKGIHPPAGASVRGPRSRGARGGPGMRSFERNPSEDSRGSRGSRGGRIDIELRPTRSSGAKIARTGRGSVTPRRREFESRRATVRGTFSASLRRLASAQKLSSYPAKPSGSSAVNSLTKRSTRSWRI